MEFDPTHEPNRDHLTPELVELMNSVFYRRRAAGFNVQFMNEGKLDEWSFNTRERAEAFASSLERKGIEPVFSA